MGAKRNWKPEEDSYLAENWGKLSVPKLAENLGRSVNAILVRKQRLGLGAWLDSGDFLTLNQLTNAITGHQFHSYQTESWIRKRGLPIHNKRNNKCTWKVVYLDEFWKWADKNRSFIDFSRLERFALGKEPNWMMEQRRKDTQSFAIQRKEPWTHDEDSKLTMLLKQHKYGYAELSEILQRSAGAIQRRCSDLGLRERPVRADNHSDKWTEDDYKILADGIRNGDSYAIIGKRIGKSEKAVRGKVYFVYLTENADKVRGMMGSGNWGCGAPEPTVKQGIHLSRTRTEVRNNLSMLLGITYWRRAQLGDDPYWQRLMCQNWNEAKGCTANCDSCDICTEFRRIPPQYCARCGGTFYERVENRFCAGCRAARKKQAQKHWCRTSANSRKVGATK